MRKSYFVLVIYLCLLQSFQLKAHCCVAPDFTTYDINGNTINLYDILHTGKTVILNVSVASSATSWNYHNTGSMQNIWDDYGPAGSDEVVVLFVEGHPDTGLADLQGTTPDAQGDWITGTSFPIIDDDTIPGLYQIFKFPAVLMICPDKSYFYYGGFPTAQTIASNFHTCGSPEPGLHPALLSYNGPSGEFCNYLNFTPTILFQNNGEVLLEQVEIALKFNDELWQTKNFEINLPSFQCQELEFDPVLLEQSGILSFEIISANQQDKNLGNNTFYDVDFSKAPKSNAPAIHIEITTDDYGYETYWELVEDDGTLVASGGNPYVLTEFFVHSTDPDAYENQTTYTYTIPVESDRCYSFSIYDAAFDGICCFYGDGSYKATDEYGNTLFEGGTFYRSSTNMLDTWQGTLNKEKSEKAIFNTMLLYPIPTIHSLNLSFDLAEQRNFVVEVYNSLGQRIKNIGRHSFPSGQNTFSVATSDLADGVYILKMSDGIVEYNKKFVVRR